MVGELLNWLSRVPARFLRGSIWLGRQKPSLMVAIGKRRNVNALEEYRRRFELAGDRGLRRPPAPPDPAPAEPPQRFEAAKPGRRIDGRGRYRQEVHIKRRAR